MSTDPGDVEPPRDPRAAFAELSTIMLGGEPLAATLERVAEQLSARLAMGGVLGRCVTAPCMGTASSCSEWPARPAGRTLRSADHTRRLSAVHAQLTVRADSCGLFADSRPSRTAPGPDLQG